MLRNAETLAALILGVATIVFAIGGVGLACEDDAKPWRFIIIGLVVCMVLWMLIALGPLQFQAEP